MALMKDRTRIFVRGLGNLRCRLLEPTVGASFLSAGHLKSTTISFTYETEEIIPETGLKMDLLSRSKSVMVETNLQQSGIDEITLLRDAEGKVYAFQYYGQPGPGRFQYFCVEVGKFAPGLKLPFQPGERLIPAVFHALSQDLLYDVPEMYVIETANRMAIEDVGLWLDPDAGLNAATTKVLDVSGWARHGTLSTDYAGIWQVASSPGFWRFDGSNDSLDFGSILNDDASGDFIIEGWIRVQGANASLQEILGKKSVESDNSAGFTLVRTTGNKIAFKLSSGSASASVVGSASLLQDTWAHVAAAIDRNGNGQIYRNGALDGAAVAVSSIGSGTNALSLYLGRDGTNFGQVDIAKFRIHCYAGGGLPTAATVTAMMLAHYTAEKATYGL